MLWEHSDGVPIFALLRGLMSRMPEVAFRNRQLQGMGEEKRKSKDLQVFGHVSFLYDIVFGHSIIDKKFPREAHPTYHSRNQRMLLSF